MYIIEKNFVANRHIYKHNDLTISFVAKLEFTDKSEEIMVILPIKENDNIISLSNKIREKVSVIRHGNEEKAGANKAIDILGKLPNILRVPIVCQAWCASFITNKRQYLL